MWQLLSLALMMALSRQRMRGLLSGLETSGEADDRSDHGLESAGRKAHEEVVQVSCLWKQQVVYGNICYGLKAWK
jgi:hypothetical protein